MTSIYITKSNGRDVLLHAQDIATKMEKEGIKVLRIKLETLAKSKGVTEIMQTKEYKNNLHYYFEFHFKVDIKNEADQQKLDQVCKKYQASYAINFLSKNRKAPLISYRVRGDYDTALDCRNKLHQAFIDYGLTPLVDGTHYEFTIYDTNYSLDKGMVPDPVIV